MCELPGRTSGKVQMMTKDVKTYNTVLGTSYVLAAQLAQNMTNKQQSQKGI